MRQSVEQRPPRVPTSSSVSTGLLPRSCSLSQIDLSLRVDGRGDASALQAWLLVCCQHKSGGLRDKPGKRPDFYHTCYCLSGLSLSQRFSGAVLGPKSNSLRETDALLNVCTEKLRESQSALGQSLPNAT